MLVGLPLGPDVGLKLGDRVEGVDSVGVMLGDSLRALSPSPVGLTVGELVGEDVGLLVGAPVGLEIGKDIGPLVGFDVGTLEGLEISSLVGQEVGLLGDSLLDMMLVSSSERPMGLK